MAEVALKREEGPQAFEEFTVLVEFGTMTEAQIWYNS
jgi:hypothetical protein